MNQKNYQYLTEALAKLGFGEVLNSALKVKMELGEPEFSLSAKTKYGTDQMGYLLKFAKKEGGDYYFLNSYKATLTKENSEPVSQEFLLYKQKGYDVKEAYNLLSSRAVYKVFRRDGETIGRWSKLDFNNINENGNAMIRSYYDNNTNFSLARELSKLPLAQASQEEKEEVIKTLQSGDKTSAYLKQNGQKERIFIEVAPHLGSLILYNNQMERIKMTNENAMTLVPDEIVVKTNSGEKANATKENNKIPETTKQLMDKINNQTETKQLGKKVS